MCAASILAAGCANARHLGALERGSQEVAEALHGGAGAGLEGLLGRYDEVRVYVQHTAIEPPADVVGQLLVGAGAVMGWARLLYAQTVCADPDNCTWAGLDVPADAMAWRCAGRCCEIDVVTTSHRYLYLERVCFASSPLRVDTIHLVDGD